ncbi:peptidoglycan DD-metalloendopeptidase family protein [candidate division GN15 bacterium]|nr:peptidoglycan DD-metalloendopeptidase family protein [candidate division GN15 bacterium]
MLKRKLTLMVIPDTQNVSRQLTVPVWLLYAGCTVVACLLLASVFFGTEFLGERLNEAELSRLEAENQELADKYESLRWSLAETESRYSDLVQKEIALRTIFDLPQVNPDERKLGIGGPVSPAVADMSESQQLAYSTEAEVDHLLRLSSFELEKYAEVEESLLELRERLSHTPSIWPSRGWFSSGFGYRSDPFTGTRHFHRGVDIANHQGTPVVATADGVVKEYGSYGRMGKMLVIDHGFGFITRFGHLANIKVKRGQKVERGQLIATMGSSGRTTGPHLHYEVWRNGKPLNPMNFILNDL